MKIVRSMAQAQLRLYAALAWKEADIRKKGHFIAQASRSRIGPGRVIGSIVHRSAWSEAGPRSCSPRFTLPHLNRNGLILSAFLGFVDRHFDDKILAITIHYR